MIQVLISENEMKHQVLSLKTFSKLFKNHFWIGLLCEIHTRMSMVRKSLSSRVENVEEIEDKLSLLDLPELILECILEKLPPSSLCQMAGICHSLRERCVSDYFWERHMKKKWGGVIGQAAYREWKWHVASNMGVGSLKHGKQSGLWMKIFSLLWPFQGMKLKVGDGNDSCNHRSSLPVEAVMNWYLAIETGRFWFPAQVYNRENGHLGFLLSCYDAELSYDSRTNTFLARYPSHGRREARECGIPWERIRAPPVDISPHDLHISNCLNDLHPGNHIEIQWRRKKEFPYGWWYGVVGHLESCNNNENHCRCHNSDSVMIEFNHYTPGSRWRQTSINRKDHREEGNEADGFYGGIRKIESLNEISIWKRMWPSKVLD
ncbi:putative F-box domain-containing protein [Medicago truncatula]|uniref:Putative F-box domain-containing protein n=1 Tax=Medicago truncatula TaxID=3880 RepID=A0A396IRW4_MEDTR|nr:putative F-box domain-containing protein [Medicago truncatula]